MSDDFERERDRERHRNRRTEMDEAERERQRERERRRRSEMNETDVGDNRLGRMSVHVVRTYGITGCLSVKYVRIRDNQLRISQSM